MQRHVMVGYPNVAIAKRKRHLPSFMAMKTPLPPVQGQWLDASTGHVNGSGIPREVADQLVGRRFASFKEFREAFWMAVAAVPHLAAQFGAANQARMLNGAAPFAPRTTQRGLRRTFEIHHTTAIAAGGGLYDLSGMRVMTPRGHADAHGRK